jgi:hypothetical protein
MAITADLGDKDTAQEVAKMIIEGLTIERVSRSRLTEIMSDETFMNCPHGNSQPELFTC